MIDHMTAGARRSTQAYIPDSSIAAATMTKKIRQYANLSYGARFGRLKKEFWMQRCEQHKLHPDSDCEMCKFRQLVLPTGNFTALTSVTVQDEKIVTKEEI